MIQGGTAENPQYFILHTKGLEKVNVQEQQQHLGCTKDWNNSGDGIPANGTEFQLLGAAHAASQMSALCRVKTIKLKVTSKKTLSKGASMHTTH